jgi:hypothetical protein
MGGNLIWGDEPDQNKLIDTIEELDHMLDELTTLSISDKTPMTVELTVNDETMLRIVVGLNISQILFVPKVAVPTAYSSHGDWSDEEEYIVFFYREHYSETPKKYWVAIELARDAMREYFRTGSKPTNVVWA